MAKKLFRGSKILRKSYKSKSGKVVPAKYIVKPGLMPGKSTQRTKQLLTVSKKRSIKASNMFYNQSKVRCAKGKILHSAYTRKGYTKKNGSKVKKIGVQSSCIKDVGLPGKGKKLAVIEDHFLSQYGYHNVKDLNLEQRKSALMSLIKHFTPIKGQMPTMNYVIRALNYRYILNRNTNPKVANIFRNDRNMISKMYKKMKK